MSKKDFESRLLQATKQKRLSAGHLEDARIDQFKETLGQLVDNNTQISWLISHEDLEFTKELGSGRSGMVFKGLYKGKKAAIKVMVAHAEVFLF